MARSQGSRLGPLVIEELDFSRADDLEDHIASHGVRLDEIVQVFLNKPSVMKDRHGYMLVGCTDGGRLLTVPIAPTRVPIRWRPKTAYESDREEQTKFGRKCDQHAEEDEGT